MKKIPFQSLIYYSLCDGGERFARLSNSCDCIYHYLVQSLQFVMWHGWKFVV